MSPGAERRLWRFFLEEARYKGMGGDRLVSVAVDWRFSLKVLAALTGIGAVASGLLR